MDKRVIGKDEIYIRINDKNIMCLLVKECISRKVSIQSIIIDLLYDHYNLERVRGYKNGNNK